MNKMEERIERSEKFVALSENSFYKDLGERKKEILNLLNKEGELSLDKINANTKMSLPLISYHLNGNQKSEGLKKLELIESREEKGRCYIEINLLGEEVLDFMNNESKKIKLIGGSFKEQIYNLLKDEKIPSYKLVEEIKKIL